MARSRRAAATRSRDRAKRRRAGPSAGSAVPSSSVMLPLCCAAITNAVAGSCSRTKPPTRGYFCSPSRMPNTASDAALRIDSAATTAQTTAAVATGARGAMRRAALNSTSAARTVITGRAGSRNRVYDPFVGLKVHVGKVGKDNGDREAVEDPAEGSRAAIEKAERQRREQPQPDQRRVRLGHPARIARQVRRDVRQREQVVERAVARPERRSVAHGLDRAERHNARHRRQQQPDRACQPRVPARRRDGRAIGRAPPGGARRRDEQKQRRQVGPHENGQRRDDAGQNRRSG